MAIQTKIKLSESMEIDAYIRINTPRSYKNNGLELAYDIEYYFEKNGFLIKVDTNKTTVYQGGDVWGEAYLDLKSLFKEYIDI